MYLMSYSIMVLSADYNCELYTNAHYSYHSVLLYTLTVVP